MGFEQSARDAGVNIEMPTIRAGNFDLVVDVGDIAFVSGSIALRAETSPTSLPFSRTGRWRKPRRWSSRTTTI